MTQQGPKTFHPVEVSLQGYPMFKNPWKKDIYYRGFGQCCIDQSIPTTCEHDRNPHLYKHLRVEPKEGAEIDVYGYPLPLPPPRKTFNPPNR
jgi:hypothetical protein